MVKSGYCCESYCDVVNQCGEKVDNSGIYLLFEK